MTRDARHATTVDLDVAAGVATVTLNGPSTRNALSLATCDALISVIDRVESDQEIGVLILTGAGGTFCSGADRDLLDSAVPLTASAADQLAAVYETFARVHGMCVPTIAAVAGAAVGAGLNLALAADLRIVADDARLISGFSAIGLHPGGGHLSLIADPAGREAAAALAIFGRELRGADAVSHGLAWEAVPEAGVLDRARELAGSAARQPILSRQVTASLRANAGGGDALRKAINLERAAQMLTLLRKGD